MSKNVAQVKILIRESDWWISFLNKIFNKKSVNTTSETSHITYRHYPLIPSIHSTVTNPANLVEGVAADGWIRGGLPSRDLTRDQAYACQKDQNQY